MQSHVSTKALGNAMHTQLMEYFTFHNLLASQQYGFRPNRSTELAALELMDRNINFMNQGFCPVNIYLDLSKAFDSPNYDILLSKLKFYGLQNNALQLLNSYLSDQGWPVALTGGICHRYLPVNTGMDNTPKSGVYRHLLAFINI